MLLLGSLLSGLLLLPLLILLLLLLLPLRAANLIQFSSIMIVDRVFDAGVIFGQAEQGYSLLLLAANQRFASIFRQIQEVRDGINAIFEHHVTVSFCLAEQVLGVVDSRT
jgi:hypothetical protein